MPEPTIIKQCRKGNVNFPNTQGSGRRLVKICVTKQNGSEIINLDKLQLSDEVLEQAIHRGVIVNEYDEVETEDFNDDTGFRDDDYYPNLEEGAEDDYDEDDDEDDDKDVLEKMEASLRTLMRKYLKSQGLEGKIPRSKKPFGGLDSRTKGGSIFWTETRDIL